jgi:DNA-binding NtrC family response regulator
MRAECPQPGSGSQWSLAIGDQRAFLHVRAASFCAAPHGSAGSHPASHPARIVQMEGILSTNTLPMTEAIKLALQVAGLTVDILLEGETGCGKDMLAKQIHERSKRPGRFVGINCAAIPEQIAESELFGHEVGAFTGATRAREGKLEVADKGTLYLDEIDSMPAGAQAKLLRALQDRGAERLGGSRFYSADFRVIASTKTPLHRLVLQGSFRRDLYFRVNVVKLRLPPLRETPERIVPLFLAFAREASDRHRRPAPSSVEPLLQQMLLEHAWPGNVRELRNAAERHSLGLPPIDDDLDRGLDDDAHFMPDDGAAVPLRERLRLYERKLIQAELQRCGGSVSKASKALQVPSNTLYYRMKALGLQTEPDETAGISAS